MKKVAVIACMAFFLLPVPVSGQTVEWTSGTIDATGTTIGNHFVASSGEKVGVAYDIDGDIWFALGDVNGWTLTEAKTTATAVGLEFITGTTWVIYFTTGSNTRITKSTDDGATWGTPVTVNAGKVGYNGFSMVGGVNTFSIDANAVNLQADVTEDGGSTWSQPVNSCGPGGTAEWPFDMGATTYGFITNPASPFNNWYYLYTGANFDCTAADDHPSETTFAFQSQGTNLMNIHALQPGLLFEDNGGLKHWAGPGTTDLTVIDENSITVAFADVSLGGSYSYSTGSATTVGYFNSGGVPQNLVPGVNSYFAGLGCDPTRVEGFIYCVGDDSSEDLIFVTTAIPEEEELVEPSEFEEGFKATIRNLGFKTVESQYFMGLVVMALVLLGIAAGTKEILDDKNRVYLMGGAAAAIAVSNIFLTGWQLWQFIIITVFGGTLFLANLKGTTFFHSLKPQPKPTPAPVPQEAPVEPLNAATGSELVSEEEKEPLNSENQSSNSTVEDNERDD